MKIKESLNNRIFTAICYTVVFLWCLICLYPLWLVVVYSFSDPEYVNAAKIWLLPKGFSLAGYIEVFKRGEIMKGYWNTITQTLVGTTLNMLLTIPSAYALAKKDLVGRNVFMKLIIVTMFFSGGLIPAFINMKNLGLLNNWWVIPLTGAVSATNLIIARTFFLSSIPAELEEAATIDGCSVAGTFVRVVLPLSKAMLGVILLYYLVAHWNNYTAALYFTPSSDEYWPLQMVLRRLMNNLKLADMSGDDELAMYFAKIFNQIKYATIVIASIPVLVLYPFVQKYFDKGVMLGSVKG